MLQDPPPARGGFTRVGSVCAGSLGTALRNAGAVPGPAAAPAEPQQGPAAAVGRALGSCTTGAAGESSPELLTLRLLCGGAAPPTCKPCVL